MTYQNNSPKKTSNNIRNSRKIKKVRRFNPKIYVFAIAVTAIILVGLLVLSIHMSGVRYVKCEVGDLTVKFLGKVDGDGNYLSGDLYFSSGKTADYLYDSATKKASLKYSDGNYYTGELDMFIPHGKGRMEYAGGSIYVGDFVYGTINGEGTFYYNGGDKYTGSFLDGLKHGHGRYEWPSDAEGNFDVYEGEYYNDLRNGEGTYTWSDGSSYVGAYVNDFKQGSGKMTFVNGDVYEGQFALDLRTGNGKYIFVNGDLYEGDFFENKITGYGTYTWASPESQIRTYTGYFEDGVAVVVDENVNN